MKNGGEEGTRHGGNELHAQNIRPKGERSSECKDDLQSQLQGISKFNRKCVSFLYRSNTDESVSLTTGWEKMKKINVFLFIILLIRSKQSSASRKLSLSVFLGDSSRK